MGKLVTDLAIAAVLAMGNRN